MHITSEQNNWKRDFYKEFYAKFPLNDFDWSEKADDIRQFIEDLIATREKMMIQELEVQMLSSRPPEKCGRYEKGIECNSCPEMKGRANGFKRAIDIIKNFSPTNHHE